MAVFITIITGVFVFILGQIVLRLFIEPWQGLKKTTANVASHLLYYANVYSNPGLGPKDMNTEAGTEARKLASELAGYRHQMPFCSKLSRVAFVPSENDLLQVERMLIALSNSTHTGDPERNGARINQIIKLLKLRFYEELC